MKNILFFNALACFALVTQTTIANTALASPGNEQHNIEQHVDKLDRINFLPNLLPAIINNSDVLELSDEQLNKILGWRDANRENVIALMNEIINKRIEIKEAALSPDISSSRLIQQQNEIFRLQRQLLEYKLSCRELMITTFNATNWEEFFLVLADMEIGIAIPEVAMAE